MLLSYLPWNLPLTYVYLCVCVCMHVCMWGEVRGQLGEIISVLYLVHFGDYVQGVIVAGNSLTC